MCVYHDNEERCYLWGFPKSQGSKKRFGSPTIKILFGSGKYKLYNVSELVKGW